MMSHERLFVPSSNIHKDRAVITERDDINHIKNVLRLKPEERLTILDGEGTLYKGIITSIQKERIELRLLESAILPPPKRRFILVQSLPKNPKMDYIIRASVEIGVSRIIPILGSRSIPKPPSEERLLRWRRIVKMAAEQSRRSHLPSIDPVRSLRDVLKERFDLGIVLYEEERERGLRDIIKGSKDPQNIAIFVGPEGGFSQDEIRMMEGYGVLPCSLGKGILRVETASLVALSILRYEFGDIG